MMGRFDGKVVLITGVARGQGRSHAVRFAEEGADVVGMDICEQIESVDYPMSAPVDLVETTNLVEKTGRRMVARHGDVRRGADLDALVAEGIATFGRIDVVIANAGILTGLGVHDSRQSWQDALDVMLTGVFNTIEAALPSMIEQGTGGSIVITSSSAGLKGLTKTRNALTPGFAGYIAAKHGVVGLMRAYANSLATYNIRCNTVHPSGVNTPMVANEAFGQFVERNPELGGSTQNLLPVQMVEARDVTGAVLWLCSDDARYITGVTLPVDAGFAAG